MKPGHAFLKKQCIDVRKKKGEDIRWETFWGSLGVYRRKCRGMDMIDIYYTHG